MGAGTSKINGLRLAGLIVTGTSIAIFAVIFGLNYVQSSFANNALFTIGQVVANTESCSDGCAYSPVIEFVGKDENVYRFESSYAESPPRYEIGAQVDILYNPDNPTQAEIAAMLNFWTNPIMVVFGGLSIIAFIIGIVLLLLSLVKR